MSSTPPRLALGCLALSLLATPAAAQQPAPRARAEAALDSIARAAVGRQTSGFVVLAMRGRDTLAARAVGLADAARAVQLRPDHVFQIASITKQFTAVAVLQLVDAGKVSLDAPVTRYLPDAPLAGRPVTVRQLLAHTAGVPDFAEIRDPAPLRTSDIRPESLLAVVRDVAPYFEPGALMRYSNTGFVLLGQLVEKVSGRPYAAYVEERVLKPAGAVDAHFCGTRDVGARLAVGHEPTADGVRPATPVDPRIPWAAGGFCATARDLAAWNASLHAARGGRLLSSASYAEMTRPGVVSGGRRTRYGLGLALGDLAGRRAVHHGGDIAGFTSFTAYLPDDSVSVVVLVNTQGPTRPELVARAVVAAALGEPATASPSLANATLETFAGRYGSDVRFSVLPADGGAPALELARGPLPKVRLRLVDQDARGWTFSDGRARYTFERPTSASGSVSPGVWADLGVALVRWTRSAAP